MDFCGLNHMPLLAEKLQISTELSCVCEQKRFVEGVSEGEVKHRRKTRFSSTCFYIQSEILFLLLMVLDAHPFFGSHLRKNADS